MSLRAVSIVSCLLVAAACTDGASTSPTSSTSDAPPTPSTPEGAVVIDVPPATPADEIDVDALVPAGSDVTGHWAGRVGGVEQLIVAVAGEGDAFARDRSLWRWSPELSSNGWLGVPLLEYPARRAVLSIDAVVRDVTGDGNDDALVFALTGGSGGCGTWSVVDLTSTRSVYRRDLCDAAIDPSAEPLGLVVRESVYRQGDPHCCPSARRETVLTYDDADGRWNVARRETTAL